ncbi:hypothetical protein CONLIGDRAFT_317377 [Coniochaeta ligniaria NRRL 30616]|uniref:Uncharacterized protein n=1 Tax=Coniochaeta ligniaria NRRL 30616 TaxID=1408157 RepID=A0A1J7JUH3_9PEZI|nr:hypothetical protein CONLIGDRAFT_317377 [Coniochaeta ligniaria NRRL 30616]
MNSKLPQLPTCDMVTSTYTKVHRTQCKGRYAYCAFSSLLCIIIFEARILLASS